LKGFAPPSASAAAQFDEFGFCIFADAAPLGVIESLISEVAKLSSSCPAEPTPGVRNIAARVPAIAELAASAELQEVLASFGASGAFLVRSIFFDKQPGANWKVPWHQDLTIAVRRRQEVPGYGPWSEKGGTPHVQPPAAVLERMITLRVHLDDCSAANGALKVIPGSHRHGALSPAAIQQSCREQAETICEVARGGILAMRPLLLHASSPAAQPRHRRVIHLEFATSGLDGGLEWGEAAGLESS
jgi:ectoine hydroxylase-related dioxygenase (phytanoyl-CoA dioxygenase family)